MMFWVGLAMVLSAFALIMWAYAHVFGWKGAAIIWGTSLAFIALMVIGFILMELK